MKNDSREDSLGVEVDGDFVTIKLRNIGIATIFDCEVRLTVNEACEVIESLANAIKYIESKKENSK